MYIIKRKASFLFDCKNILYVFNKILIEKSVRVYCTAFKNKFLLQSLVWVSLKQTVMNP